MTAEPTCDKHQTQTTVYPIPNQCGDARPLPHIISCIHYSTTSTTRISDLTSIYLGILGRGCKRSHISRCARTPSLCPIYCPHTAHHCGSGDIPTAAALNTAARYQSPKRLHMVPHDAPPLRVPECSEQRCPERVPERVRTATRSRQLGKPLALCIRIAFPTGEAILLRACDTYARGPNGTLNPTRRAKQRVRVTGVHCLHVPVNCLHTWARGG